MNKKIKLEYDKIKNKIRSKRSTYIISKITIRDII